MTCPVHVMFHCYQHPNTSKPKEPHKFKWGNFVYSISIHNNNFIGKNFRYEEEKLYEVSQYTNEFFVRPIMFCWILSTARYLTIVYTIQIPFILISWLESITSRDWSVLGLWKSIIIKLISIFQKGIYTLSSRCMHRSLTCIGINSHLYFIFLVINIFKHMWLRYFGVHFKSHLNTVQLTVLKFLMFHDNE